MANIEITSVALAREQAAGSHETVPSTFERVVETICRSLQFIAEGLLLAMLLMISYDVGMRYIFNEPTIWANEVSTYALVAVTFIGLAPTHLVNGHIRVDLLLNSLSAARREQFILLTSWLGLFFVMVAVWQCVAMIYDNYDAQIRTFSLLTQLIYVPQIPIALGLAAFALAMLAEIRRKMSPKPGADKVVMIVLLVLPIGLLSMGKHLVNLDWLPVDLGTALILIGLAVMIYVWSGFRALLMVAGVFIVSATLFYLVRGANTLPTVLALASIAAILLAMGMRISLALGTVGLLGIYFLLPTHPIITIANRSWESLDSFTLTALPMFVLMGAVLLKSGLTDLMFDALTKWTGGMRGGIAYAGVGACSIFAAVSGSSVATAATIGMAACPEMIQRGYSPRLAYGAIAAGGTLGILIPPSIVMIIYGSMVGVPIATLFIAGILPGLLLTSLFMLVIFFWTRLNPDVAPMLGDVATRKEKLLSLWQIFPIIALIGAVIGVLYAGIATPTEAAAVGTLGAFILCLLRGKLNYSSLREMLGETVKVTSFLLMIVVAASVLSFTFDYLRLPALLVEAVQAAGLSPAMVIVAIAVPYIVLGMFVDPISMMVMTLPVLFPLVVAMEFDPVWFGIILVLLVEIGLICPPVGMNLSVLRSVTGYEGLKEIVFGVLPFMLTMALFIVILYLIPNIALWLPNQMQAG